MDEDFVCALIPRLLESLCESKQQKEKGDISTLINFLVISTQFSRECRNRLPSWLLQFLPNIQHGESLNRLLLALPKMMHQLDRSLEEALLGNVRRGNDLSSVSFSTLVHFKSARLSEFLQEEEEEELNISLDLLIEAANAFPNVTSLHQRIRSSITSLDDPTVLSLLYSYQLPSLPKQIKDEIDLFLMLVQCSQRDDSNLNRQLPRLLLSSKLETAKLLRHLPQQIIDRLSGPLLYLFSHLLTLKDGDNEELISLLAGVLIKGEASRRGLLNLLSSSVLAQSGNANLCLQVLQNIISNAPSARWSCLGLIKGLLDGLEGMSPAVLDSFYRAFALLAKDSDSVLNELMLLVKKQLLSHDYRYKRIGARGVVIICDVLGKSDSALLPDPDDDELIRGGCSQAPQTQTLKSNLMPSFSIRMILSLLEEAVRVLMHSDCFALAVLIDGLSQVALDCHPAILEWISEWSTAAFKELFIRANESEAEMEEENAPEIVINLVEKGEHAAAIASLLFRLLVNTERAVNDGSLESIDALSVCPIERSDDSSLITIFSLKFAALSLMREIISSFSMATPERFKELVTLQAWIGQACARRPAYLDELQLASHLKPCLIRPLREDINESEQASQLEEHDKILSGWLEEACQYRKLTPLRAGSDDAVLFQSLSVDSIKKCLPSLPVDLLQSTALSEGVDEGVRLFCLAELRDDAPQVAGEVAIELWKRFGPKREFLETVIQANCRVKEAIELANEVWSCEEESLEMKGAAFTILKRGDTNNAFSASPLELIKNGASGDLIKFLNAEDALILAREKFDLESVGESKSLMPLFKSLLELNTELFKTAGVETIDGPIALLSHLVQYARLHGSGWLMAVIKGARACLEALLKPPASFFSQIEADGVLVQAEERMRVMPLLRHLQQCTRSLQVICSHVKYTPRRLGKRKTLKSTCSAIPLLKRSLEALLLRVKDAVARCGCSEAFWVGNLKHRDLEGQELSSQVAVMALIEEESSEPDQVLIEDSSDYEIGEDTVGEEEEDDDDDGIEDEADDQLEKDDDAIEDEEDEIEKLLKSQ